MKTLSTIILFFLIIVNFSCETAKPEPLGTVFTATLSGAQEVPAINTTATGTFEGILNNETKVLTYTITYSGLNPTAWHIHKAAAGTSGGVIFNFGTTFTSPYSASTIALTDAQVADLMGGLYYANIHTATNKGGEIRGQISKK
jgi:ABC-type microcin C transport system permease subunit YejE